MRVRRVLGRRGRADVRHGAGLRGRDEGVDDAAVLGGDGGVGGRGEAGDERVEVGAPRGRGGVLEVAGDVDIYVGDYRVRRWVAQVWVRE